MEAISIRYGESLTLPVDSGDATDVSADIYIGVPGQSYVLTKQAALTNGEGNFVFAAADTRLPLGTYYYQININDVDGEVQKFPSPQENCEATESDFPKFVIREALDEDEVS